jgi:predicted ATP-grasp superfamily ATP-dependent carboligase
MGTSVKRPVLILGWIPRIIIPIARSLHRHGVPVDLVSFVPYPPLPTRAIQEFRSVPRPDLDRKEFVRQLREFILKRGHDMVILADDCMLAAVTEDYDDLADITHLACPPPAVTRLVLDKSATLKIAQNCGIHVPRTEVVSNSSQLQELIGGMPFPWIVKPARKQTRLEEVKSSTLTTSREVAASFPKGQEFDAPMLVQEYCGGVGVGVEILLHTGECVAGFQHRRLKEFPYTGGVSVTAVAERVDEALLRSSLILLRALQWDGVAMVEYKVDSAGGAVLLEVNGRYWGTISLPIFAGIDFPLYHWKLAHGEPVSATLSYSSGIRWRWTLGYLGRLYILFRKAGQSARAREALRTTLGQLFADFSPSVRDATFRISDPLPSVVPFLRAMCHFASHAAGQIWRKPVLSRQREEDPGLTPSKT